MDVTFTSDQAEAGELARQVFTRLTADLRRGADSQAFRADLWQAVRAAGLADVALTEVDGGSGLDLISLALVVSEAGRCVLPVPLGVHAAGCLVAGPSDLTTTVGLAEVASWSGGGVRAEQVADGWRIRGTKIAVPHGQHAGRILVSAMVEGTATLFVVHPEDAGVEVIAQSWSGGFPVAELRLDATLPADRRIDGHDRLVQLVQLLAAAEQLGVLEKAVELTASYVTERHQFGRPLGSFQAVSQRLADAWIAAQGLRLTLWQAAWHLEVGRDADVALATAQYWAAEAGDIVGHAAVHLHGGAGVDLDGAIHPYFVAAKRLEHQWGGAGDHARRIGRILATENS